MKSRPTGPDRCLATYGTLAPGQVNAHELDGLSGTWRQGTVEGRLVAQGWGATHGCPGLVPEPGGGKVPVAVFLSDDLPGHWARLDSFEGRGYQRLEITVATPDGPIRAFIYALADRADG